MSVNWSEYAAQYDLLAQLNPAYQSLVRHCVSAVKAWALPEGAAIADFGAGTGNLSVSLAQELPHLRFLHIERDPAMNALAAAKASSLSLSNWRILDLDLDKSLNQIGEIAGAVSVHAIYTLAHSKAFITTMSKQVTPGGYCCMADIGRPIEVFDWAKYIFQHCRRSHGLWQTLRFFARTGKVRKANREISRLQKSGVYWTHDLSQFRKTFEESCWQILFSSEEFYRGITDVIIARKRP